MNEFENGKFNFLYVLMIVITFLKMPSKSNMSTAWPADGLPVQPRLCSDLSFRLVAALSPVFAATYGSVITHWFPRENFSGMLC